MGLNLAARLGRDDQLHALQRLDAESRRLESLAPAISFESVVNKERSRSWRYGGRTVFGWEAEARRIA